ncbi:hypothetical protein CsSME_00030804 [Camellia sinensis var. sinensis]
MTSTLMQRRMHWVWMNTTCVVRLLNWKKSIRRRSTGKSFGFLVYKRNMKI